MQPRVISTLEEMESLAIKGELVGLFEMPIDIYHQGPGISSTGLKALLRSPAHFAQYMRAQEDSTPMRNGRIAHVAVLEPGVYERDYVVAPDIDRRTNAGKAAYADFVASSLGKNVVSAAEHELAQSICEAVRRNKMASRVLRDGAGTSEVSVFWYDDETGVLCKARADRLIAGVIADLKTCQDAQPREFQRAVVNYKYHLSAAFYTDGFSKVLGSDHRFCWVAVETPKPHGVAFYGADEALIATGRSEYREALRVYRDQVAHHKIAEPFPSYPESFVNLTLPAWYAS